MDAIQFLTEKGILKEGFTKFIIKYPDGSEVDLVDLFEEFGDIQYERGGESQFYGAQ